MISKCEDNLISYSEKRSSLDTQSSRSEEHDDPLPDVMEDKKHFSPKKKRKNKKTKKDR